MKFIYNPFTKRLVPVREASMETPIDAATLEGHMASEFEMVSNKGIPNGYASLDSTGKVPAAQLPSYVDDVQEYTDLASFPASGESGVIYVALDTKKIYRWSGSSYIEISPSEVTSVDGRTGAVTLSDRYAPLSHTHDWTEINNKPSPIITLQGDVTGSGTMNELGDVTIDTTVGGSSGNGVPIGSIMYWPSNTPPSGWLKCNGTAANMISKVDFPDLFSVVGYTFGQDHDQNTILTAAHTSNTSSTGTVSADYNSSEVWKAFDQNDTTAYPANAYDYNIYYTFNSPQRVTRLVVIPNRDSSKVDYGFRIHLYAGATEVLNSGQMGCTEGTPITFDIANPVSATTYKIWVSTASVYIGFFEIQLCDVHTADPNLFGLPNIPNLAENIIAIIKALP